MARMGAMLRLALACAGPTAGGAPAPPAMDADVIIIGLGPVGSYLSHLLDEAGVGRVLGFEKNSATYHSPRAVVWDDYTIRTARAAGAELADYMRWHAWVLAERWHLRGCTSGLRSGRAATRWNVVCDTEANDREWRNQFMASTSMPVSSFHQPSWERELRRLLEARRGVAASFGREVLRAADAGDHCEVTVRAVPGGAAAPGPNVTYRARYCVATDGAASHTRRHLGFEFRGESFPDQPWIVVDTEVHDAEYLRRSWIGTEGNGFVMAGRDGPETLVRGRNVSCPFVFIITPAFFNEWWEEARAAAADAATEEERAALRAETIRRKRAAAVLTPGNADAGADAAPYPVGSAFRFEFLLEAGTTEEEATSEEYVNNLLTSCAEVDPTRIKLIRKVVYTFHARRATSWRAGRVLLAGDAAHCMPPFQGQGLNSGIRDALNLAWKLALVLRGQAADAVLDSYEVERRVNLEMVTQDSINLGELVMTRDPWATWVRDVLALGATWLRDATGWQNSVIADPPHIATDLSGLLAPHELAGRLLPCPAVRAAGAAPRHRRLFLEDLGSATGFTLVLCGGGGVEAREASLPASQETVRFFRSLGTAAVAVAPYSAAASVPSSAVPVVDGLAASRRCVDADGYWTKWTRRQGVEGKLIVVRPDRYIFGVFGGPDEAKEELDRALKGGAPRPSTSGAAEL